MPMPNHAGGSEWSLEDTIELKDVSLPDPKTNVDLSLITGDTFTGKEELLGSTANSPAIVRTSPMVPSPATIQVYSVNLLCDVIVVSQSVKRSMSTNVADLDVLQQKQLVQLDWVSTEDGAHILTVAVGHKVSAYVITCLLKSIF